MKYKHNEIEKELKKLEKGSKCCKLDITTILFALAPLFILFVWLLVLIWIGVL